MKKICFVIMGYGKRQDYISGKSFDLDKTYQNIIKPSVENAGYECVRGDEIQESGVIDKNMYGLLIHADLVIADITTFNPNAIYELGIRHAARPFSTIVMKERDGNIPFDISHNKIFTYAHMGEDISATEAARCQRDLTGLVLSVERSHEVDSPLFQNLQSIQPYTLPQEDYMQLIRDLAAKERHIFTTVELAKEYMRAGNFTGAAKLWQNLADRVENDAYFIQQLALCIYKSKLPSERMALVNALNIISKLEPDGKKTNDAETLGITGSIYKRLWFINNDIEFLKQAIAYYEKGFNLNSDYYTGENYALCLELWGTTTNDAEEKIYCRIEAKRTRSKILEIIEDFERDEDFEKRSDLKWIYATLSNSHLALGNMETHEHFEKLFYEQKPADWEIATYLESKELILRLKK